jgi:hypothetical protein
MNRANMAKQIMEAPMKKKPKGVDQMQCSPRKQMAMGKG